MICISGHPRVWCCFTWPCGEWGKERMVAGLSGGSFWAQGIAQLSGSLWALPWAPQIKHKLPPAAQVSCALPSSCCTCSSRREEAAESMNSSQTAISLRGKGQWKIFISLFVLALLHVTGIYLMTGKWNENAECEWQYLENWIVQVASLLWGLAHSWYRNKSGSVVQV